MADGCHLNRDIETALLEAGFELDEVHYIDVEGIPKIGQRMLLARNYINRFNPALLNQLF